jgi:hypothetical protein
MNHAATLSPAAPRPAHIPASAVYGFDMFPDSASPKALLAVEDHIRALANRLIDNVVARALIWDV